MKGYSVTYRNTGFKGSLQLPGSKSISNRLLIIKALAASPVRFTGLSDADDTVILYRTLKMIRTCSKSGIPMVVNSGHAGTVMRFLTAYLAQYPGKWLLTGSQRMQQRPIAELVHILRTMNADITYLKNEGTPPLLINGKKLKGGTFKADGFVSSQFLSALMMIAPYIEGGLTLQFNTLPVSFSYIKMTATLMSRMDARITLSQKQISVAPSTYNLKNLSVEPDWSSAAFWYELVALSGKAEITLPGLSPNSLQGDKAMIEVFHKLGVTTRTENDGIIISKTHAPEPSIEYDFSSCPDIVPAVMATCSALGVEATFKGIEHLRFKESDRIEKMERELSKTATQIIPSREGYTLIPGRNVSKSLYFDTHNDHRLAMALAPMAAIYRKVHIADPDVVFKSYPRYWEELQKTGMFSVTECQV